jgi:hypothetical protein
MRKWQNLAPPDDAGSWFDVSNMWPTAYGSYATADYHDSGTAATATGTGAVVAAWCANTLASRREYVFTASNFIWEYAAGVYTDRSGGVTVGTSPFPVQYGDVSIVAMGVANPTVKSTGGNFSALAGSPNCEILLTVANAVLALNTSTSADGWAASDIADYTNWTTGEAASGRLIQSPGPITAGVSFGNYAIVFKADAIYRISYVGGIVKWATELLYRGIGCQSRGSGAAAKYLACAGGGVVFFAGYYDTTLTSSYFYTFDGVSAPRRVNPLTTAKEGFTTYNPQTDTFAVYSEAAIAGPSVVSSIAFYNRTMDAWGYGTNTVSGAIARVPLLGDYSANSDQSTNQTLYGKSAANFLKRWTPGTVTGGGRTGTCYLQTSMAGSLEGKLTIAGVIPRLRRYATNAGTPTTTCTIPLYSEMYGIESGAAATPASTATATTNTNPRRQDVTASNNFARPKITWTDTFVDVDDFIVQGKGAGLH